MGREMQADDVTALLARNLDHPRWDEVASAASSCTNCTMVCPTCFCTSVEDTSDLAGVEQRARSRRWDSCFTLDFSYHSRRQRARRASKSRYRQWMTHKLATWHDQFGIVRLRRLRTLHRLVSGRHRHHRGERAPFARAKCRRGGAMSDGNLERIVKEHPFFAGLDGAFCRARLPAARRMSRSRPDQYLFHEGEPADWFYLLRHGRVAIADVRARRAAP